MKKKLHFLFSGLIFLSTVIVFAQCPPTGGITITNQLEVDDFAANYPNCTIIDGFLSISGTVTDLSAFDDVTTINGYLEIFSCPNLTSVAGFENLTSIGALYIYFQYTDLNLAAFSNLTTVSGILQFYDTDITNITMDAVTSAGSIATDYLDLQLNSELSTLSFDALTSVAGIFSIFQNPLLEHFSFNSLTTTGDYCYFGDNQSLVNFSGLENLTTVNNYLFIGDNPALLDIAALSNLTTVNGFIQIDNNNALTSLIGLNNVNPLILTGLNLSSSANLSTCNLANICTYLSNAGVNNITGNAIGCSNVTEVLAACATNCPSSTHWDGVTWSNGAPTSNSAVMITGDYVSTGDLQMCSVTVANNADVIIAAGDNLEVGKAVHSLSGTLTFENNANLLQDVATINNSNIGAIKYHREASIRRLDYVFWSAPVAAQNLLDFSPQTLTNRFYTLDEVNNAFVAIAPASNNYIAPQAYMIRAPNNFPNTVQTFTGVFDGTPNNGTYTLGITNSGVGKGFNLIGNPYPSPISADDFLTENPGTLYFWTHFLQGAGGDNYATYTNVGTAAAAGGEIPNGFIQAGQGFILHTATSGTATFTNAMRIGNNDGQFFRSANNNLVEKHRLWINLSFGEEKMNQLLIGYVAGATEGFDAAIDGPMNYNGSSISSSINAEKYTIQGRPLPFSNADEVLLFFKAENEGTYSIAVDHVDGIFAEGQAIFIKDELTGIVHNLTDTAYAFASVSGEFPNRFRIVYQSAPLAIEHPDFDSESVIVYKQNDALHINAGTMILDNVKLFDISGRLLYEKDGINAVSTALFPSITAQQLVLLQITSSENKTITKKAMF